jgi:hypothetical protein
MSEDIKSALEPTEAIRFEFRSSEEVRAQLEEGNSQSGFMRLSPELRNRIYQDTIPTSTRISVVARLDPKQISLLQVCRAIRKEAVPIFYGNTTFTFDLRIRANFQRAKFWLDALSPEAIASLRKIYVNSEPICCCKATSKHEPTRCRAWVDLDSARWSWCGFEGCRHCTSQDGARDVVCRIRDSCAKQTVRKEDIAELFEILRPIKAFEFSFEVAKDGGGKATFQDRPIRFGSPEAKPAAGREIKQPRSRRRNAGARSSDMISPSSEYETAHPTAPSETGRDSNEWKDPESDDESSQLAPFDVFKDFNKKLRNALDDPMQDCVP